MSRKPQCRNAFARYEALVYHQAEPYGTCEICGEYIYIPGDEIILDGKNQIYHASCVEKEESA